MSDLEPFTPAMESAGLNKLADRLGWIAAQLGDIGWGDDSASVAQASVLIRRQASPVLDADLQVVQDQRDIAINMLAKWCVAVKTKGSGWDAWDAHYKNVLFGPGPLRELLDEAIGKLATEGG